MPTFRPHGPCTNNGKSSVHQTFQHRLPTGTFNLLAIATHHESGVLLVKTENDDDLGDKMWESNLKHGVQYSRDQRQTRGLKLHERGLAAKVNGIRVGVSASSVYSWARELRAQEKQERYAEIARLREEGMTQQEIADEVGIERSTVAKYVKDSETGKIHKPSESEPEPAIEDDEEETGQEPTERLVRGESKRTNLNHLTGAKDGR